jgi:hypothetical protein
MDNWQMVNWSHFEAEAQHRRLEWERAAAAAAQVALASPKRARPRQSLLPQRFFSWLTLRSWLCRPPLVTGIASRKNSTKLGSTAQPCRAT